MGICDAPPEIPEWEIGAQGAKLKRRSCYFEDAKRTIDENERKNVVGVLFRNSYGKVMSATIIQYERMRSFFDSGQCEVIDWIRNQYAPQYYGLEGYDTEGVSAFARMGL